MVTLWIGDFRTKQLQNTYQAAQQAAEYHYLVEDVAEYSWFNDNIIKQFPTLSLEKANVVIMLGFNDCVYSCIWNTFNITQIAEQYATAINTLITKYPSLNFYTCAVNPINGDYPFTSSTGGTITKNNLDEKIRSFNSTISTKCTATFIDSYGYLTSTSFSTRDGIRFIPNTCIALHNFIKANITTLDTGAFSPRLLAPDPEVDSYLYWTASSAGGVNPFTAVQGSSTLPSCIAYAWGRFYEITGEAPKLSTATAECWYLADGTSTLGNDKYKRGSTPKVGAIACWQGQEIGGANTGYVAVVEQVNTDGSIITSESGWDTSTTSIWRLQEREKGTGNWGMDSTYTFQGFIYCPQTSTVSKEDLCTKNSYSISEDEMKINAQYIWQYLSAKDWSLNAVAGLLGNLQVESKMSPAIWESTISGSIINTDGTRTLNSTAIEAYKTAHNRYPGYGLVQWTPYSKYTDWCTEQGLAYWDMDSQLQRIIYEAENKLQWIARPSKGYDLTFEEFMSSTKKASWLAAAFAFCYERPASSTGTAEEQAALKKERGDNGTFWYNYLSTLSSDVTSTNTLKISDFKIDKCLVNQISVSFLTNLPIIGTASLLKDSTEVASLDLAINGKYGIIAFNNLIPNTTYKIQLSVRDINNNENIVTRVLSFTTLQDYPNEPKKVELRAINKASDCFTLTVNKPDYLGYWGSNSGYDIVLIIDGKIKKTISIDNANQDIVWETFSIKDKFDYTYKIGDNLQIGVRTWIKDSSGIKIYQSTPAKSSSSICLLSKNISLYLHK